MREIRIATRKSPLALAQTEAVIGLLRSHHPQLQIIALPLTSAGDDDPDRPLHGFSEVGVFVKRLEKAVLTGEADCALHCLKDLPAPLTDDLTLPCFLPREEVEDILICRRSDITRTTETARIATGSPRRRVFLSREYPVWEFTELRGNINTRLSKVITEVDGIVLAQVGIERLKRHYLKKNQMGDDSEAGKIFLDHLSRVKIITLPTTVLLPAPGQGILTLQCRADDEEMISFLKPFNHLATQRAAWVEREVMTKVEGGCRTPLGVWAREDSQGNLIVEASIERDGKITFAHSHSQGRVEKEVNLAAPSTLADEVVGKLLSGFTSPQN